MTFLTLMVFGAAVRTLTAHRLRSNFDSQITNDAIDLADGIQPVFGANALNISPQASALFGVGGSAVRIYYLDGTKPPDGIDAGSPYLGPPLPAPAPNSSRLTQYGNYCVVTVAAVYRNGDSLLIQYGLPLNSLRADIANLDSLVLLGILVGTALAFGAGWLVARRAIKPIAELTAAAMEIERTGDPTLTLPEPTADDEVAELTRTLTTMLVSLDDARGRTESALAQQRAFVADASHELRTPLTSVLANLELLEDALQGPELDLARSALRSTQRMRRLVADLLLLARSDVKQPLAPQPADLAELVIAAAVELEPSSNGHELELDVEPTPLLGSPDDLQRLAINLIENAIRHTPPGTHVRATTRTLDDGQVELVVADDGPGIPPEVRKHMFARFARGGGEVSGSFGLGLAIVQAVAEAHNATIDVKSGPRSGTRFSVRFPGRGAAAGAETASPAEPAAV